MQAKTHALVMSSLNSVSFSLLDLDTNQNMHNQNEVALERYKVVQKEFFLYKVVGLQLILLITFRAIVSPETFSSKSQTRYVTVSYVCFVLYRIQIPYQDYRFYLMFDLLDTFALELATFISNHCFFFGYILKFIY